MDYQFMSARAFSECPTQILQGLRQSEITPR
jgi:hypothetical protein